MKQVIKSTCSGAGSSLSGVSQRSVGAKEMHYVLRVLGPAACRNPVLFSELARKCMRIALPPPSKRGTVCLNVTELAKTVSVGALRQKQAFKLINCMVT